MEIMEIKKLKSLTKELQTWQSITQDVVILFCDKHKEITKAFRDILTDSSFLKKFKNLDQILKICAEFEELSLILNSQIIKKYK